MIEPVHNHRHNILHTVYADIARQSINEFNDALKELAQTSRGQPEYRAIDVRAEKSAMIGIVFAALSIEAQIYDFAARYFGDNYVATYLDKLDLVAKWLIIPKLVSGRELARDTRPFNALVELVGARNRLVHHKSSPFPWKSDGGVNWDAAFELSDKNEKKLIEGVRSAGDALNMLQEQLFLMTNDDFAFLAMPESTRDKHRDRWNSERGK